MIKKRKKSRETIINKAFKFRLFVNSSQNSELNEILNACRILYNLAIFDRQMNFTNYKTYRSYEEQRDMYMEYRHFMPIFEKKIHSQTVQNILERVDNTFKAFYSRIKEEENPGFPRYKFKNRFNSFTFPQLLLNKNGKDITHGGISLNGNSFKINKISGVMKLNLHRKLEGTPKAATIVKEENKWFVIFIMENDKPKCIVNNTTDNIVALDAGLKTFMTKDNGEKIKFPNMKSYEAKIKRKQLELQKKTKGSNRRETCRKSLNKAHLKNKNRKLDFLHKTSRKLVNNYDVIILEKLNIKSMIESDQKNNTKMSRNIHKASWGKFMELLRYKAEEAGKIVIFIDPRNTSKTCYNCGNIKEDLSLKDRVYECKNCSYVCNRDINAAKNIRKIGKKQLEEIFKSQTCRDTESTEHTSL